MSVSDLYLLASVVVDYLSAVDFVHLIKTCRYIHDKNVSTIPVKRQKSLVKFMNIHDTRCQIIERGYKLPNGKIEGKYEELLLYIVKIGNYVNGDLDGFNTCYDWPDIQKNDKLYDDFNAWKDIDLSSLRLTSRKYADGSSVPVPGRPTDKNQVNIPSTGQFFFDVYSQSLYNNNHIFMYRYVDGIVKDIWINGINSDNKHSRHMDLYQHISFMDTGKIIREYCSKWNDNLNHSSNLISCNFIPLNDPMYHLYHEYNCLSDYDLEC